jgi:hypothetical protein
MLEMVRMDSLVGILGGEHLGGLMRAVLAGLV